MVNIREHLQQLQELTRLHCHKVCALVLYNVPEKCANISKCVTTKCSWCIIYQMIEKRCQLIDCVDCIFMKIWPPKVNVTEDNVWCYLALISASIRWYPKPQVNLKSTSEQLYKICDQESPLAYIRTTKSCDGQPDLQHGCSFVFHSHWFYPSSSIFKCFACLRTYLPLCTCMYHVLC